jgi:hypothetical protein
MSVPHSALTAQMPPRHSTSYSAWIAGAFGLVGGPAAWYLQLCAGYVLASGPCFPHDTRRPTPLDGFAWTWPALIAILIFGVLVALAAFWVSWRTLNRVQHGPSEKHPVLEANIGRTRFLALWGMVYGAGFALATLVTAVAYIVLPRCAG